MHGKHVCFWPKADLLSRLVGLFVDDLVGSLNVFREIPNPPQVDVKRS